MCFHSIAIPFLKAFEAFTSLCACMGRPKTRYDVLCNEAILHCSGSLEYPVRLTLKKSVVFHEMPNLRLIGYDSVIPGEYIILKNTGTSRNYY